MKLVHDKIFDRIYEIEKGLKRVVDYRVDWEELYIAYRELHSIDGFMDICGSNSVLRNAIREIVEGN